MSRTASSLAVALLSAGSLALSSSPAAAVTDRDCPDFTSQAAAQAAFDSAPGDPERLDRDGDGQACEDFDYGAVAGDATPEPSPAAGSGDSAEVPPAAAPRGGVAAGAGGTADPSSTGPLAAVALGGVLIGAGVLTARRRSSES